MAVDVEDRIYLGKYQGDPIITSADGGISWAYPATAAQSSWIVASPGKAGWSYALFYFPDSPNSRTIFARTIDGGSTWQQFRRTPLVVPWAVDPEHEDVVYVTPDRASNDATATIGTMTVSADASLDEQFALHMVATVPGKVRALAIARDWSRMWAAMNDRSLLVSRDRGHSFEHVPDGPIDSFLRSLATDPFDSTTVYGVTDSGQIWTFRDDAKVTPQASPAQIPSAIEAEVVAET